MILRQIQHNIRLILFVYWVSWMYEEKQLIRNTNLSVSHYKMLAGNVYVLSFQENGIIYTYTPLIFT